MKMMMMMNAYDGNAYNYNDIMKKKIENTF